MGGSSRGWIPPGLHPTKLTFLLTDSVTHTSPQAKRPLLLSDSLGRVFLNIAQKSPRTQPVLLSTRTFPNDGRCSAPASQGHQPLWQCLAHQATPYVGTEVEEAMSGQGSNMGPSTYIILAPASEQYPWPFYQILILLFQEPSCQSCLGSQLLELMREH